MKPSPRGMPGTMASSYAPWNSRYQQGPEGTYVPSANPKLLRFVRGCRASVVTCASVTWLALYSSLDKVTGEDSSDWNPLVCFPRPNASSGSVPIFHGNWMNCQIPVHNQIVKITVGYKYKDMCLPVRCAHLQPAVKSLDTPLGSHMGMNTLCTLARKRGRECVEVLRSTSGPTEIRTRVSAVRGQRPWPLDDGALPCEKFRGRDSNPDSTVQSRMSCLLDDPGMAIAVGCSPLPTLRW